MFGSSILEVAIGLVFIYLLLSLICSAANEVIASVINKRGKHLLEGIKHLLSDGRFKGLAQQVYTHGLVASISRDAIVPDKPNRLPSYVAANTFALALIDILAARGAADSWKALMDARSKEFEKSKADLDARTNDAELREKFKTAEAALEKPKEMLRKAAAADEAHAEAERAAQAVTGHNDCKHLRVAAEKLDAALAIGRSLAAELPLPLAAVQKAAEKLPEGNAKACLLVLIEKSRREAASITDQILCAERQVNTLQENIEIWFNDSMDRVSGWYKRWAQTVLLALAAVAVVAANADTIMLAKRFSRDAVLRASVVAMAEKAARENTRAADGQTQTGPDLIKASYELALPLGWIPAPDDRYKSDQVPETLPGWLIKLLGLVVSVCAVSLGAPFWFDTLSKFVNIRGSGAPPGEARKRGR